MQPTRKHQRQSVTTLAVAALSIAAFLVAPAAAQPETDSEYVIGPGDVLQVIVFGEESLSGSFRVEAGGQVILPHMDSPVDLGGATLTEAQARIIQRLAKILKRPRVTVTLDEEKSVRLVSVMGAVVQPGLVQLPVGATAFSAIARAGGFAPDAGSDSVLLLRPSGEGERLDLSYDPGDGAAPLEAPDADALVHSGDIVWVPRSTHRITILGPVARPGRFAIQKGEPVTVLDLVSGLGQGPAQGSELGTAMLVRQDGEPQSINLRKLLLEGDLSQNVELAPGDTVIVAEAERVSVVGAVNTPTSFAPEATATLVDALSRASGLTARADMRHASIIRNGEHLPVDLEAVWLRGDMESDIALSPGDIVLVPEVDNQAIVTGEVARPGTQEVQLNTRLLSILTAAGGPTAMADLAHVTILRDDDTIDVDLSSMFKAGVEDVAAAVAENVPVLPGDVVFVPKGGVVYILGAVGKPGSYAIRDDLTIVDAIAGAGGVAAHGAERKILLARRDESGEPVVTPLTMKTIVERGSSEPMLQLRAGDIVYVASQKQGRNYSGFRDIMYGVSGLLFTLF
jgi:protein involved in polysaccharide export with SLBB domain